MRQMASAVRAHNRLMATVADREQIERSISDALAMMPAVEAAIAEVEQSERVLAELAADRLLPVVDVSMVGSPALRATLSSLEQAQRRRSEVAELERLSRTLGGSDAMRSLVSTMERADQWVADATRTWRDVSDAEATVASARRSYEDALNELARSEGLRRTYDQARQALRRDEALRRAVEEAAGVRLDEDEQALDVVAAFTTVVVIALVYMSELPTRATGLMLFLLAEAWRGTYATFEAIGALAEQSDATKGLAYVLQMALPYLVSNIVHHLRREDPPPDEGLDDRRE